MAKISTNPPKGTFDWDPSEFMIRKYIFDVWRDVCTSFGYLEYLTPIIEKAEIYKAKSGEDLGGKELFEFVDRAGRELAIRPEMTPSVTRMVVKDINSAAKPIKLFSIANFMRNERPQRGRNREFWQLNFDVFGIESINADFEIILMAIELMLKFKAPKDSFNVNINNRKLVETILNDYLKVEGEKKTELIRILDKYTKLPTEEFDKRLDLLGLDDKQKNIINLFMKSNDMNSLIINFPDLKDNQAILDIKHVLDKLKAMDYDIYVDFKPNIIRGFDYYDGIIFEVFDNHPDNNRAMFGGGRYNGLAEIFGAKDIPAVGCAPGDEPMRLFLESWGLLPEIVKDLKVDKYYIPILNAIYFDDYLNLASSLRAKGEIVEMGYSEQKLVKALNYANKKGFNKLLIMGDKEKEVNTFTVKDMEAGSEVIKSIDGL